MTTTKSPLILVLALLTFSFSHSAEADELVWGESVGLISGTVMGAPDADGLAVRSTPSQEGKVLTHLKPGATVQGQSMFRGGWVNMKAPVEGGWVRLAFLKPYAFEGAVTKVNQPDLCLPLKKGPGDSHETIGCAQIGEILKFSGVATSDKWLQLADRKGWAPMSHLELVAWAVAAETSGKGASSSALEPSDRERAEGRPALARQAEPGFPALPTDQEDQDESPEAQVCQDEWCVDFVKATISRGGKPESFVSCARDEICATILAEFWIALLEDEAHIDIPITDSMNIRFSKDGEIRNAQSGGVIANCRSSSGPEAACVVSFLLDISRPILGSAEAEKTEPTAAAGLPKEKDASAKSLSQSQVTTQKWPEGTPAKASSAEQTKSAKPESRSNKESVTRESKSKKPQTTRVRSKEIVDTDSFSGTKMFTDPAVDQDAMEQKQVEEAWDNARRQGY